MIKRCTHLGFNGLFYQLKACVYIDSIQSTGGKPEKSVADPDLLGLSGSDPEQNLVLKGLCHSKLFV